MSEDDAKYGENIAEQKYNIDHNWNGSVEGWILEQKWINYSILCKLDDELINFFSWVDLQTRIQKLSIITHQKWGVAPTK